MRQGDGVAQHAVEPDAPLRPNHLRQRQLLSEHLLDGHGADRNDELRAEDLDLAFFRINVWVGFAALATVVAGLAA